MMNKIVKTTTTALMATTILFGGLFVAPVATAEKAEAYTASSCYSYYEYGWQKVTMCWIDYNWWEESWMGGSRRDGWYRMPGNGSA